MQGTQGTIWDILEPEATSETRLDRLLDWSFNVFDSLSPDEEYQLGFSGGKDSHVLAGVYLSWCRLRGRSLNLKVVFSDTLLESAQLYKLIDGIAQLCDRVSIPFVKVQPSLERSFWVRLIGMGYPVPDYRNRWCTKDLKTHPMSQVPGKVLTGAHYGESTKRDQRLDACGSSECGIDQIANKIEPLAIWRNCDVWDFLIIKADEVLYQGVSEKLMSLYDITESENGSLRMGCFACPVVAKEKIAKQVTDGIIPSVAMEVRELLEKLRSAPRILSARTGKAGASLVDARIAIWEELQPLIPEMQQHGWITSEIVRIVESMLANRTYPPTYKQEWIQEQEPLAKPWTGDRKNRKPQDELSQSLFDFHDTLKVSAVEAVDN